MVVNGMYMRTPGRSTRMSPGSLPSQCNLSPARYQIMPTTTKPTPIAIKVFPVHAACSILLHFL